MIMAQNVQRWLLDRERFAWAREHVPERKWFQISKYFPGYVLRRQMVYIDAETGDVIGAQGGEQVPDGRVFLYGYDVQAFCGIDVPGLEDAMTAKPPSRLAARGTSGDAKAPAKPGE
ncbi:MAG: hypothetical protein DWI69_00375 [Chloroflexi bacterium]|nr:MAG: hypothetical protein DWI69_00375 [Chloroflexota bacterium]